MSIEHPDNFVASVRQRLLNLSRKRGEDFQLILTRYAVERLLYRLSKSEYTSQFILKGAMLLNVWMGRSHRPTRDLDFSGYGDVSPHELTALFREICQVDVEPDGLEFDSESIQVSEIREDQEYEGQRVKLTARLGNVPIYLQVDIGFGDAVSPEARGIDYPVLLDFPAPRVMAYPVEAVVSEKLQAMVYLGMINSRMKDFYDLLIISRRFSFDGPTLVEAIKATFGRRRTSIPESMPVALSAEFSKDSDKVSQWKAFLGRTGLGGVPADLARVIDELKSFLFPPLNAASRDAAFNREWSNGGPWKEV